MTGMTLGIGYQPARHYTVSTPVFEGPLDLLLHLIERAELDITKLALAQVTDQYLEHLRHLPEGEPEEVSAFLVIAARLLQIKSEALLPRPPMREPDEEDPGEALARQLIIYKRFKELAGFLEKKEASGQHTYLHLAPPPKVNTAFDLSDLSLQELLFTARVLILAHNIPELATVVAAPRITIREKIGLIAKFLRQNRQGKFSQLLSKTPMRLDIVVTFLAILELVKRSLIITQQDQLFGDIQIESSETWDENLTFELEFGE